MVISPIQNFVSTVLSGAQPSVSSSITASAAANPVQTDSSSVSVSSSTPSTLLAASSLQTASVGLAQLSSLLTEAQSGTQQVGNVLQKLQSLAGEAQAGGPPSALASLNSLFQEVLSQINQIASSTSFGGNNLLDGTSSSDSTEESATGTSLSLPDLTTQGLFGSASLNISTVAGADTAASAITNALSTVNGSSENISQTLGEVNFTAASVNTALANNTASTSVLTDSDLSDTSTQDILSSFLGSPAAAATAQTSNLPPTLLSLLQE